MTRKRTEKRKTNEWPTVALAAAVYLAYGALTWFYHELPWWLLLPLSGYLVCLHGSLQHEAVHGHPTGTPWIDELTVFPSLWLWLPFRVYRQSHRAHHLTDRLADPLDDPESYYVTPERWQALGAAGRAYLWLRNTVLGRLLLSPIESVARTWHEEVLRLTRGDLSHLGHWAVHLVSVALVLAWVLLVCEIPLTAYVMLFAYPGLSLTLLRSFLEHRAHPEPHQRTVVIEAGPVFSLMFLNNNLHAAHHEEPGVAWYRLPRHYRDQRARLLAENGGYRYSGYLDVIAGYLLWPKEMPVYPLPLDKTCRCVLQTLS